MRYFLILILLLLIAVSFLTAITLALGLGVGWLLTRFMPFSLFEATVLGLMGLFIASFVLSRILQSMPDFDNDEYESLENDSWDDDKIVAIPKSRFLSSDSEPTWALWYQFIFANDIYHVFKQQPDTLRPLNETQQKELAIRLAEVAVQILKAKPASTRRLNITSTQYEKMLAKMGQKPYDDEIMSLTMLVLNEDLSIYYEGITEIIREKNWNRQTTMFEYE